MSYASSEKQFYQRHYEGGLQIAAPEGLAETREEHYAPGKRYNLLLEELSKDKQYGTAVEIGCADGRCLFYLANQFKFQRLVGLDIGFPDDMQQTVNGVEFVQANSNHRLPLDDGSVDVVAAMMVIEHLFDPFHSFAEIKRILSPQGAAVINLPLVTSIKNRVRLAFGKLPETSVQFDRWLVDREWDGNHLHYFSVDSIRRLSAACGLKMTRMAGVGSGHRLKSLAPSLFANELSFVVKHASS